MSSVFFLFEKQLIPEKEILGTKYDYSTCTGRMNQYAFVTPTNGWVTIDGVYQRIGDFRNLKTYREYKDCGFDTLLLLGNDTYNGEEFETSDLKMNLELAKAANLKVIVHDKRLHDLTMKERTLIGNEFESFDALVAYVKECMTPYMGHPNFYGITLYDEPRFQHLAAVGEITRAVKAINEDFFVHTCLLPYFAGVDYGLLDFQSSLKDEFTKGLSSTEVYEKYIATHLENTGAKYVAYDNYPIFYTMEEGYGSKGTMLCFTYFHTLQMVTEVAQAHGAKIDLTIQTYADKGTPMRQCDEDDIRFQAYAALAFACMNVSYFTYFMFPTRGKGCGICQAIMDDYGNKIVYNETQRVNEIAQKVYAVTANFKYAGTDLLANGEEPKLFEQVKRTKFDSIAKLEVTQPTLVNRLVDETRGVEGFMLVNSSDPAQKLNDRVELTFKNARGAVVYIDGNPSYIALEESKITINITCGDGVFVIPVE